MLDSSLALVQGQRGADAGYLDEQVDGSPARPPTRVHLARQRRMPYGCKNVSRPGPYGNPFTFRRGLSALFWSHLNLYGRFEPDMANFLDLGIDADGGGGPVVNDRP